MFADQNLLWLNLGSHLRCLHRPLLRELSHRLTVSQWDYQQSLDEPACLEIPLVLLHDYLKNQNQPVHLAGHGLSGALAVRYAQRYPNHVRSLTLLGVSPSLEFCWQSHYYMNRRMLNCDRSFVFSAMVSHLFGETVRPYARELASRLRRELDETPSPHSLLGDRSMPLGNVPVPLLVCGSQDDIVISPENLLTWQHLMNPYRGDYLWQCPEGRHFFHYFNPKEVGQIMVKFWQKQLPEVEPIASVCSSQQVTEI